LYARSSLGRDPLTITVYAPGASGNATPTATIGGGSTGLVNPVGIAVDGAGNIYVANSAKNTVTVYAAGASGNATPTATIAGGNTGLSGPFFITSSTLGRRGPPGPRTRGGFRLR